MSREDPQFKLRMPLELRLKADLAAKAAGRSLNAELVGRLEASFLSERAGEALIPAKKAKELAASARSAIPNEVRKRAKEAIANAVKLGHTQAVAKLDDLKLGFGIPDEELEEILSAPIKELEDAGYIVSAEDISGLWIEF